MRWFRFICFFVRRLVLVGQCRKLGGYRNKPSSFKHRQEYTIRGQWPRVRPVVLDGPNRPPLVRHEGDPRNVSLLGDARKFGKAEIEYFQAPIKKYCIYVRHYLKNPIGWAEFRTSRINDPYSILLIGHRNDWDRPPCEKSVKSIVSAITTESSELPQPERATPHSKRVKQTLSVHRYTKVVSTNGNMLSLW